LTAKTIVKGNNKPLVAGDIAGAGHILILQYDATNGVWQLANPQNASGTFNSITNTGLTSGRVVYSTTGGLETDSAGLTFDGTNFATTGTATAAKLIPTGSSATGNGLYLPAANSVGISTNGANAVYIDANQNVGIGTSSPSVKLDVSGAIRSTGTSAILAFSKRSTGTGDAWGMYSQSGEYNIYDYTAAVSRLVINSSGNLLVGTNATFDNVSFLTVQFLGGLATKIAGTASTSQMSFFNDNGRVGWIGTSGTVTSYNTSSDYRLKNTIAPMTGALAKVAALKPVTYKWNSDNSDGEGFIAHELAEVCPHAVTGEKDAVDSDGKPKYQGIDVSFLVATLTAAIQEQQALITSLTARIEALEAK